MAIVERFIESGAKVIIWDINEDEIKNALAHVNSKNLTSQIVDVTNFESINKNLKTIFSEFGKIDIFILMYKVGARHLFLLQI